MTILPDKKKIYGKTEEILIDKLFDYYGLAISDVSIAGVFELALAEKQTTQNVNPETIKKEIGKHLIGLSYLLLAHETFEKFQKSRASSIYARNGSKEFIR